MNSRIPAHLRLLPVAQLKTAKINTFVLFFFKEMLEESYGTNLTRTPDNSNYGISESLIVISLFC